MITNFCELVEMSTKEEYLTEKLNLSYCTKDHKQEKKICRDCLFSSNGVFKQSRFIPECTACIEDTSKFSSILRENEIKGKITLKIKCGESCIWFEWFHKKRLGMMRKGQELVYEKNR